jgi:hypothetical protein
MNPYEPPTAEPPKKKKKQKVEIDLKDFLIIFFVVLIGTPLIYGTVLEIVDECLSYFFGTYFRY